MMINPTQIQQIAQLDEPLKQLFLNSLSYDDIINLKYTWELWARPEQLPPQTNWGIWLYMAGRGAGKTRAGAEWVRNQIEKFGSNRIGLIAPTAADARDIMIEGESGIMNISPPDFMPKYEPSKRRITWPNGAHAHVYSAEEPDRLRGPQHEKIWAEEVASWKYPDAWDMAMFGNRLGENPQACITTTPKPVKIIRDLMKDPFCILTKGTTYDNRANLAPLFYKKIVAKYEGTRLGRQEIHAEVLEDTPGALWTRTLIESLRVKVHPDLKRIVIAIDPAVTSRGTSAETGIMVCSKGINDHGYLLEDLSLRATPKVWASQAIKAYYHWKADKIIGEVNNGGDLVEEVLRTIDSNIPYKSVHASRGKYTRAEPISSLYEQKKIHHVGLFERLEDQQCTYTGEAGEESPDRMDAMVWGFTELMTEKQWEFLFSR